MANTGPTFIEVSANGISCRWEAMNKRSALRQAKFEAERGATVIVESDGKIIWTNNDDHKESAGDDQKAGKQK